jgi:hypothetical protein
MTGRLLLLKRLMELEADVAYRRVASPGEESWRYIPGRVTVLLSAPHAAAHCRNGRLKEEDEYTAALARFVGEQTGAHVLYVRRQLDHDPNYDRRSPYKELLGEIIRNTSVRFVLDLHGASDQHDFGIELGTIRRQSCKDQLELILAALAEQGFTPDGQGLGRLELDGHFTGGGGVYQETVTRYVWETLKIPAAQMELNSRLRVVYRAPKKPGGIPYRGDALWIERTVLALMGVVRALTG